MINQTLHNRYTITARLGKGAMGTVYRATDSQTGQEVAVKSIARELAFDDAMLERFKREGEALRQLRHPNIVGFVDAFQHNEQYFLVMEYVQGGSLLDLIKRGPLPTEKVRQIALELCDALTRAHYLNVVHRDLKPENVLLDTDGTPKLTDFGVARLVQETQRLTGTGTQIGTPYYMSPEAWEGKPLDAQSDIWSLGVVIYEMLSGEVPFGGETLVAVMNKVLSAPLPDIKTKRGDVPDGLAAILQKMLARDKAQRYRSMRELGADLERGGPALAAAATPTVTAPPAADTVGAYAPPTVKVPREKKESKPGTGVGKWIGLGVGGLVVLTLAVVGASLLLPRLSGGDPTPTRAPNVVATKAAADLIATQNAPPVETTPNVSSGHLACEAGQTLLFADDFEDGNTNGWRIFDGQTSAAVTWPVTAEANGNRVLEGSGHAWAVVDYDESWTDYALEVKVRTTTGGAHLNIRNDTGRYHVNFPGGGLNRGHPGEQVVAFEMPRDSEWHTVRLVAVGAHVEVWWDNELAAEYDDVLPFPFGGVGIENTSGAVYYDDVLVCTASAAPLPASISAQVLAFADPILAAIEGRAPTFEDDFSDAASGWGVGSSEEGQTAYVNGEFVIVASPTNGIGMRYREEFLLTDFVAEMEAAIVSAPAESGWAFFFREQTVEPYARYSITIDPLGALWAYAWGPDTELFYHSGPPVLPAPGRNHLRVIVKGPEFALFVNGEPAALIRDETLTAGSVSFGAHSNDSQQGAEIHVDNFRLWDIADISTSNAASPEAIAAARADPWGTVTVEPAGSITLGVAVDLSGTCVELGPDQRDAVQLAVDEAEPLAGFGVTVLLADAPSPGGGTAAAATLSAGFPAGVIGTTCSGPMDDFLSAFEGSGITVISPSASRPDLTQQGYDFFNRIALSDSANPGGSSTVDQLSAVYQDFSRKFEAAFGRQCCAPFAAEAYDAATILLKAIESVAVIDEDGNLLIPRQALARAVRATANFEGASGTITFDENGDRVP